MKLKDLIKELKEYNQEAKVRVIALNKEYDFSLSSGGSEGSGKSDCETVGFYVDELCTNENV